MALFERRGLLVAVGVSLLFAAAPAAAQTPTRAQPFPELQDARPWGPFMANLRFAIDNIGYDNNVFLTPSASSVSRESDIVVRMGPALEGQVVVGRRVALTVRDKLEGEFFRRYTDLNHLDNSLEGQFDLFLGPVLLTTKAEVATHLWRPSSEVVDRTRENDLTLGETFRVFASRLTDFAVSTERTRYRHTNPDPTILYGIEVGPPDAPTTERVSIGDALDRDETLVAGEFGWRPGARARFFLRYQQSKTVFASPEVPHDATEDRKLVGVEFRATTRLTGRFAVGWTDFRGDNPVFGATPFKGSVAETELTYRPTGMTRVTAEWTKTLSFSTFERNLYYINNLRGLTLATYLGVYWGLQGGYSVRDADYPEADIPDPATGALFARHDRTTEWYGGLLFRMKGGFEVGVRYGRYKRDSNYVFGGSDQTYFSTTGSYAF